MPNTSIRVILLSFLSLFLVSGGSAQTFEWARTAGGIGNDAGEAIEVLPDGNVLLAGGFAGNADFGSLRLNGNGLFEAFVVSYDPSGNVLWGKNFGGSGMDKAQDVAYAKDGSIFLAGYFSGKAFFDSDSVVSSGGADGFLTKLDASGNVQWVRRFGGISEDKALGVAVDTNGNAYVCGFFTNNADFSGTAISTGDFFSDVFVGKFLSDGTLDWVKTGGGPDSDIATGIDVSNDGSVYCTGFFYETATFPGGNLISRGSADIFIIELGANGSPGIQLNPGSFLGDAAYAIKADPNGGFFVTGYISDVASFGDFTLNTIDHSDIFLARYLKSGDCLWARQAGGPDLDLSSDVAVAVDGRSWITGVFDRTAGFSGIDVTGNGNEIFIAEYAGNGAVNWVRTAGAINGDYGQAIAIDPGPGSLYASGYYFFTADFGPWSVDIADNADIYLTKLSVPPVGIPELIEKEFEWDLTLNQGYLSIQSEYAFSGISILDIQGKEMLQVSDHPANQMQVHLSNIPVGLYFIQPTGKFPFKPQRCVLGFE